MSRNDGTGAAILEAAKGRVEEIAEAAGEQLQLLPAGIDDRTAKGKDLAELVRRDRAGRPEGAQNKNTREIKALCTKLFGDPMLESFRLVAHTPESLALYLGCSKLEAFDRLEKIRADLRRYYYAPMAATDAAGNVVPPFLQMVVGGQVRQAGGGARPPWEAEEESEQNQALPAQGVVASHGAVSHEDDK